MVTSFIKNRRLAFNGNQLVFCDEPNKGCAGIAPDMEDGFGNEIAKRWNAFAKDDEANLMAVISEKAAESLDPDSFAALMDIFTRLAATRGNGWEAF